MDIKRTLRRLDLNEKDIAVFLALAKIGPSAVRSVAQASSVNRGTTYDTLKHLMTQGLVSYYHQDKHQYFVAEPPERLFALLEERMKKEQETKAELERLRPELEALYATPGQKPSVKYYEGFRGAKAILRDVLSVMAKAEPKEYYVYSSLDLRQYLYQEFPNFTDERIKHGVHVKTIALGAGGELHGLDERRWLSRKESAPTYVLIYDGKVAILALDANRNIMGILIENQAVAETECMVFRSLWDKLGTDSNTE